MPKQLRALKTDEEIAAIPLNEPVLVELPSAMSSFDDDEENTGQNISDNKTGNEDDGAKRLQDDLEALKAQNARETARADKAERDRQEAVRIAADRDEENKQLRAGRESDESALITNGLAGAQTQRDAAKSEFERAFESGDAKAMAEAQSKIGRSEARILHFESGAAELQERKETRKTEPDTRTVERQQPDFVAAVNANPGLLQAEKDWMIRNKDAFNDPDFNKKLDFAYQGAVSKGDLVRGSAAYFDFMERATGLKKVDHNKDDDERDLSVSAPPSRTERGSDGHPTNGKIKLSVEQREIARSMGVSDIDYARQVQNFDAAKRADPEKYR